MGMGTGMGWAAVLCYVMSLPDCTVLPAASASACQPALWSIRYIRYIALVETDPHTDTTPNVIKPTVRLLS